MARGPLSLQARSLLAAGVALAAFLGLTGLALDAAIYQTLLSALHDRLQGYAYGYLANSEVARSRRWSPPEIGPEPRFDRPGIFRISAADLTLKQASLLATALPNPILRRVDRPTRLHRALADRIAGLAPEAASHVACLQ